MRKARYIKEIIRAVFIILAVIAIIGPIYWTVVTSLKDRVEIGLWPPTFWPRNPTDIWWRTVLFERINLPVYRNSFIIAICASLLAVVLGLPASYACARWSFKGRMDLLFMILTFRFLPQACVVLPIYMMARILNLLDTMPLIVCLYAAMNLPIFIWVIMSYIKEIPVELEESYMIDGHSRAAAFFRVILPLIRPGLIAITLLMVSLSFGEFLFAALLTQSGAAKTIPVVISEYLGGELGYEWGKVATLTLYSFIPLVLIFVAIRKHLVRGLTFGVVR